MKNNKTHLSKILLTVILNSFFLTSAFAQDGPPPNGGASNGTNTAPCIDNSIPYTPEARYGDNHKIIIGGMGGDNDGFINWNARPEPSYGDFSPNNIKNGTVPLGTPGSNIWSAQIGMNNVLSRFMINVAPTNCATSPITWNNALSIAPGRKVYTSSQAGSNNPLFEMDLPELAAGNYFLRIINANNEEVIDNHKLMIIK